jgi:putative two-component system response regulator
MRVLVVDDDRDVAELLRDMLRTWGMRNVGVTTDSTAVERLVRDERPDLVLLDLLMPEPDGLAILERLQPLIRGPVALPVVVLTAHDSQRARRLALEAGARDFLTKPFQADEVRLRVRNLLELRATQVAQHMQQELLERREASRADELEAARLEVVERLARAGEFRDDETGEHTRRVGRTARLLATAAGLDPDTARAIGLAAPLHDIGKIAIPDAILLRRGRLTPEEVTLMQRHTVIGAQILDGSTSVLLNLARDIALTHHERWDGGGYPHALEADAIPPGGRIVALADVFDALTHERPYKAAWSVGTAVAEIAAQAGAQGDPVAVAAFLSRAQDSRV